MQVHTYTNILIDVYINPKRKQYHPSFSLDLHTLQACNRRHACARARPYRACAWTAGTAGRSGHIWSVTRRSTRTCPAAPARPRRWAAPPWRPPSRPRTGSDQGSGQTVSPQRAAPSSLRQAPLPRAARPPRCRERAAPLSLGQPCHDGLRHELVYAPGAKGTPAMRRSYGERVLALVLVLRWAPQSTGSGLPVGTAQDFHVSSPEKQPLEAHRPANVLKLSPCGAAIRESVKHSPAFGTLHVELGAGASLRAEAGSMVCMQVAAPPAPCSALRGRRAHGILRLATACSAEHRVGNGAGGARRHERAGLLPALTGPRAARRSVALHQRVPSRCRHRWLGRPCTQR